MPLFLKQDLVHTTISGGIISSIKERGRNFILDSRGLILSLNLRTIFRSSILKCHQCRLITLCFFVRFVTKKVTLHYIVFNVDVKSVIELGTLQHHVLIGVIPMLPCPCTHHNRCIHHRFRLLVQICLPSTPLIPLWFNKLPLMLLFLQGPIPYLLLHSKSYGCLTLVPPII